METHSSSSSSSSSSSLQIVMYPWLAFGHITPFLHISNKLAQRGHKISFFVPTKTLSKLQHFNHFPHLITFVPIAVPHVEGLPLGAETTSDVPSPLFPLIMTAMDRTERDVELLLHRLKPDIVFFDFAHWIPNLARSLGFKTVCLSVVSPVLVAYVSGRNKKLDAQETALPTELRLLNPPPGFPDPSIKLHRHEVPYFVQIESETFGSDIKLVDRLSISRTQCDAFASKGCREIEGPFVDLLQKQFAREIWLVGPIIPERPLSSASLDHRWVKFLGGFEPNSVIYCSFGSECRLQKNQFRELLLGLELSGSPFLAALKPPPGTETVEEALPEGFEERIGGRGAVFGGWIQQQQVLEHPSVGCYVTHCGSGSLMEGLVMSERCQVVMIPFESDQIFNARLMGNRLKAGVEVDRGEEDGFFSRESVCKAIKTVMDQDCSEAGREMRANCTKLRDWILGQGFESSYIDDFSHKLQALVANNNYLS